MADTITAIAWISRTSLIWFVVLVALLIVLGLAILLIHRKRPRLLPELARHPFAKYVTLSLVAHLAIAIWLSFSSLFNSPVTGPGPKAIVVQLGEINGDSSHSMSPAAEVNPWDSPAVESVPLTAAGLPEQPVAASAAERPTSDSKPVTRSQPELSPFVDGPITPTDQPSPWDNSAPVTTAAPAFSDIVSASAPAHGDARPAPSEIIQSYDASSIPSPVTTPAGVAGGETSTTSNRENEIQQSTVAVEEPITSADAEAIADSIDEVPLSDGAQPVAQDAETLEQFSDLPQSDWPPTERQASNPKQPEPNKSAQHDIVMPDNSLQVATVQDAVASRVPQTTGDASPLLTPASNAESRQPQVDPPTVQDSSNRLNSTAEDELGPILPSAPLRRDGQAVPPIYQDRWAANRQAIARARGGTLDAERSVQAALKWIAFAQSTDGRWDASNYGSGQPTLEGGHDRQGAGLHADTGITGLALLAFLGAGHTQHNGEYAENIRKGIDFLLREQRRRRDGAIVGDASAFAAMYCHGIATLALSEAWSLTGDPELTEPVRRAISFTLASQNRRTGGWRYQPQQQGDTSQLGWQLMALTSAHYAGLTIPIDSWTLAGGFLNSVARGRYGGLAAYRAELPRPTSAMTAESLLCRLFLQTNPDHPLVTEAADHLVRDLPGTGRVNYYYWYYGTLALYHLQDHHWNQWNPAVQQTLIGRQLPDGSWNADSVWGTSGGKVYSTSLGALTLEVYYRYRPLTEPRQRETTAWNQ